MTNMNKYFILQVIFALTFCQSCGSAETHIDPAFAVQVNAFMNEAHVRNVHPSLDGLTVQMVDQISGEATPTTVGTCTYGANIVEIKKAYWDRASAAEQENLIFHELGHCLLKLGHTTCPAVMCSFINDPTYYKAHRKELLDAFFIAR